MALPSSRVLAGAAGAALAAVNAKAIYGAGIYQHRGPEGFLLHPLLALVRQAGGQTIREADALLALGTRYREGYVDGFGNKRPGSAEFVERYQQGYEDGARDRLELTPVDLFANIKKTTWWDWHGTKPAQPSHQAAEAVPPVEEPEALP